MSRIGTIIEREFMTRVRRRAFWAGTLLAPLLIFGLMAFGIWASENAATHVKVLVADEAGLISRWDEGLGVWLPTCPTCFPEREHLEYRFAQEPLADSTFLNSDFDAMVQFDDAVLQHAKAMLYYQRMPGMASQGAIARDLSTAIERFRVQEEAELDYATYKRLRTQVSLVGQDIETRDSGAFGRGVIGFVFSLFLFLQLLVYGTHVMRGVIEEKSNRIVEVIISTVKPSELLAGKIIGIGLVGLTQFLLFTILGYGTTTIGGFLLGKSGKLSVEGSALTPDFETWLAASPDLSFLLDVNWGLMLGATVLFYAAGFALFASLFAAVGAMVEQESDAQYLMIPVMVPLLGAYMMAAFAMENPEGMLAIVGSWIPFTAPVMMLVRLPLGVAWWEILLSWLGVVATAWGMILLAGRIYRTGILMYGKRPSLREIWRWIRIS